MSESDAPVGAETNTRSPAWRWAVCGLLLLATMLNYMDRQTLAQTATDIQRELNLGDSQYGMLEFGFGICFALGGLFFGILADRVSVVWLYPFVLVAWSLAGFSTAYASAIGVGAEAALRGLLSEAGLAWLGFAEGRDNVAYAGLLVCRSILGFFEAGQWPCALVTTSRLLSRADRTLGNSILQSGAALGAIFTPLVVQAMRPGEPGSWRLPFQTIGLVGLFWIVPWLAMVRPRDLVRPAAATPTVNDTEGVDAGFWRRFAACVVTVIAINLTWQFFRAWLPKFLREYHGYAPTTVNYFTSAFYVATDVGCLAAGAAVQWLTRKQWDVHAARSSVYFVCAAGTALGLIAAYLPASAALLGILVLLGAASLGLFPCYYSFTQDLSGRHQGKVTGVLSFVAWTGSAIMQRTVGAYVEQTRSYRAAIVMAALAPLAAGLVMLVLWRSKPAPTMKPNP